ncbi:hypothetical protein RN01_22385 [Cupriavidus sp. SHE]|nr:hypothetical protein RN01_22385 [Cupriavidus sp. SHE]
MLPAFCFDGLAPLNAESRATDVAPVPSSACAIAAHQPQHRPALMSSAHQTPGAFNESRTRRLRALEQRARQAPMI